MSVCGVQLAYEFCATPTHRSSFRTSTEYTVSRPSGRCHRHGALAAVRSDGLASLTKSARTFSTATSSRAEFGLLVVGQPRMILAPPMKSKSIVLLSILVIALAACTSNETAQPGKATRVYLDAEK